MSTEQNKKVAVELCARFTASDIAGVMATMTDDATWLIPGKPDASPAAGLAAARSARSANTSIPSTPTPCGSSVPFPRRK